MKTKEGRKRNTEIKTEKIRKMKTGRWKNRKKEEWK